MGRNLIETVMGAVVLVVAALFLVFAFTTTDIGARSGYVLNAKFDRVDGLLIGNDVRLSGVKVGTVAGQTLDPETYLAVVSMTIDPSVKLPADSSAQILSDGLLGGKYLALVPGADTRMLKEGETIKFTQSSVSLEQLIGKFIFSVTDSKGGGGEAGTKGPAAQGAGK
ncbi:MAG: outer membrane lipid asymmetry maintenance protein MlaD [Proteobacteria bacterium]|nr:outer membrane lipid asymmetry maintenance protein MlaD [Pseudomonadota bacterium]